MWYTAGDRNSRYTIGYATSENGFEWTRSNDGKPGLGPGENGRFDDQVVLHPSVVRGTERLLHPWYNGVGPQTGFRVGYAVSRDGIRWTRKNGGEPVLVPGVVDGRKEDYVYNVHGNARGGHVSPAVKLGHGPAAKSVGIQVEYHRIRPERGWSDLGEGRQTGFLQWTARQP